MAPMKAVFISILPLVCGFTVLAEEEPSRTKDLFEGVWLAWSPGQPYDVSDAYYLIIQRVDDNYISIGSFAHRSSSLGVLFLSDHPSAGRMLDGVDVLYKLDENNLDILYNWFKDGRDVVSELDENDLDIPYKWWSEERDTVVDRSHVVAYRRFTPVDLDQLEAFWAELREVP